MNTECCGKNITISLCGCCNAENNGTNTVVTGVPDFENPIDITSLIGSTGESKTFVPEKDGILCFYALSNSTGMSYIQVKVGQCFLLSSGSRGDVNSVIGGSCTVNKGITYDIRGNSVTNVIAYYVPYK